MRKRLLQLFIFSLVLIVIIGCGKVAKETRDLPGRDSSPASPPPEIPNEQ